MAGVNAPLPFYLLSLKSELNKIKVLVVTTIQIKSMTIEKHEIMHCHQGNKEFIIYLGSIMVVFEVILGSDGNKSLKLFRYEKLGLVDAEQNYWLIEQTGKVAKELELFFRNSG